MKIVNLDAKTLGDADYSALKKLGDYVEFQTTNSKQTLERIKDADIVLTNKVVLDSALLKEAKNLKLICITATGMNIVDLDSAKKLNIEVKNVAGYSTASVAQHTINIALDFLSQIHYYDKYVKSGKWVKSDIFTHLAKGRVSIEGKKWGIIGLGSIGKKVASIAKVLGAEVFFTSTSGANTSKTYTKLELDELLKTCDIISIHAPLNEKTQNLISKKQLSLLKKDAILINVGRGGIVNEKSVATALKNGAKFYYGADVLEKEPMKKGHVFLDSKIKKRLLLTPHIAFAYDKSLQELARLSIKNVKDFLKTK